MDEDSEPPRASEGKIWRPDTVRLSVNINQETKKALQQLQENRGITATEVIRRAISLYYFLNEEQKQGRVIQVAKANNRAIKQITLQ